jgi:hypothetical protein
MSVYKKIYTDTLSIIDATNNSFELTAPTTITPYTLEVPASRVDESFIKHTTVGVSEFTPAVVSSVVVPGDLAPIGSWILGNTPAGVKDIRDVVWSPTYNKFYAILLDDDTAVWSSWNGIDWIREVHGVTAQNFFRIDTNGTGTLLGIDNAAKLIYRSTTGPTLAFSSVAQPVSTYAPDGLAFSADLGSGAGRWLFLGRSGGGSGVDKIYYSDDSGTSWTNSGYSSTISSAIASCKWVSWVSLFIAALPPVNSLGTDRGNQLLTSPDGITWTLVDLPNFNEGGEDLTKGQYVVSFNDDIIVTGANVGNTPFWSTDGASWTSGTVDVAPAGSVFDIVYSSGAQVFVGATGDTSTEYLQSSDGKVWTLKSDMTAGLPERQMAYSNTLGIMVSSHVGGTGVSGTQIPYRYDSTPEPWVLGTTPNTSEDIRGITWSSTYGKFYASLKSNSNNMWTSTDGKTWISEAMGFSGTNKKAIHANGLGTIVGIDDVVGNVYRSTTGLAGSFSFQTKPPNSDNTMDDLTFSSTLGSGSGRWVLVGQAVTTDYRRIWYSDNNAATWIQSSNNPSIINRIFSVDWIPWLGMFICPRIGTSSGTNLGNGYLRSTDGINWTETNLPTIDGTAKGLFAITHSDTVVVMAGTDSNCLFWSTDGLTWTPRRAGVDFDTPASVNFNGAGYSSGSGMFVLNNAIPGTNEYLQSRDGKSWELRTDQVGGLREQDIAYSPTLGIMVTSNIGTTGTTTMQLPYREDPATTSDITVSRSPNDIMSFENDAASTITSTGTGLTLDSSTTLVIKSDNTTRATISADAMICSAPCSLYHRTTAERDALTPAASMFLYNSTTNKLNVYTGSWEVITSV